MFRFIPENDHTQSLRIKRFLIAAGSYVMWSGFTVFIFSKGLTRISLKTLVISLIGVLIYNLAFYAVFRSGFNKRFKDPSLTLAQMVMATFWTMEVVYFADQLRSLVLLLYLVVFVFGLFRLRVRQFLFLSLFAIVSYAIVIVILYKVHPESVNDRIDLISILTLALVLPWFSLVGGYITHLREKVSKALSTIEHLSIIDDLTQVFNRRQMYKILEQQKSLGDRGIHSFAICIFDLDHFKLVNDTYGHEAGDIVLKTLAQEVYKNLRDIDHIARYGGEEFIIILTSSGIREAITCAKRVQTITKELIFPRMPSDFRISISIGITIYQYRETIQDVINRADKALYIAKAKGRDRIEYDPGNSLKISETGTME